MNPNVDSAGAAVHPFDILIDAIAEAAVRKLEERRKIESMAHAVLQRIKELQALETTAGPDGAPASSSLAVRDEELYQMILDVLPGALASTDGR